MMRTVGLVLHYRTPERTLRCLRSLASAGCREIIVVDNSADDGRSLRSVDGPLSMLREEGCALTLVDAGSNLGFAAGVNLGLRHARTDSPACVVLVNSDAALDANALEQAQLLLEAGADLVVPSEGGSRGSRYYSRLLGLNLPFDGPGMVQIASGAVLFLSGRLAARDLFDEAFFFYGEDVELSDRLARAGARIIHAQHIGFHHEGAASARRGSLFYEYHIVRGHWLLATRLNQGAARRLLAILARAVILPMRAGLRSLRARSALPLQGLLLASWDALTGRQREVLPDTATSRGKQA